jgi:YHS domain-containing protein
MSDAADQEKVVRDPVCGKEVDPLRARAVGIFGGVTHYFCSAECKKRYNDPRQQATAPPDGVDRRWSEGDQTGNWFAQGRVQDEVPAVRVEERFTDLEQRAPVQAKMAPSPSLLIEVAATKKRGQAWIWMLVALAVIATISVLGLRR